MFLKKNITLFFLMVMMIFIHTSCGYKKINQRENNDYQIIKMEIAGDMRISDVIKNEISLNSSFDGKEKIRLTINIKKEKNILNKNIKGKITKYGLTLNASLLLENIESKKIVQRDFIRKMSYDVSKIHSDTLRIEKKYTRTLAENISEDIVNFINLNF